MSDLIDRQAAIAALNKLDVSDGVGISSIACQFQESAISAIQHLPSADPWSAIKAILNELERKQEKLYADYCDATARLKAVDKIAKSSQKPNQKIDGIKPLAEMEVTE